MDALQDRLTEGQFLEWMAWFQWRIWAAERQAAGEPLHDPEPLDTAQTHRFLANVFGAMTQKGTP